MGEVHVDQGPCYCPDCGAVLDNLTTALRFREEALAALERQLSGKTVEIRRLKQEQDEARREHPNYPVACRVLDHWKKVCHPKAKEPRGPKRVEAVMARLAGGYTAEDLMRACDGYAMKPFVVNGKRSHEGPKDARYTEASLIFRDAEHVDMGLRIADRADDLRDPLGGPQEQRKGRLSALGAAALRLADRGFFVFPLRALQKRPATRHGLLDAKRDLTIIEATWRSHPDLNVAVRCGAESGIVVLDVDSPDKPGGRDGVDSLHRLEDRHGDLPTTLSIVTPSGGQHYWFKHPGPKIQNTTDVPGVGLDIRGDGGYVAVPPSLDETGRHYEVDERAPIADMPGWLVELLIGHQRRITTMLTGPNPHDRYVEYLNSGVSQGARNDATFRYACHLFAHGIAASEVLATIRTVNLRLRPPLPDKELHTLVKSAGRYA